MTATALPSWRSVLAVVAHPDDESFGLGAVLDSFVQGGATVSVLCFTRGEASTLQGVEGDLSVIREGELEAAARVLGVERVSLLDYPDGALAQTDVQALVVEVLAAVDTSRAEGLIAFDSTGVSAHPDHMRATEAAISAAAQRDLPVLGWTLPLAVTKQLQAEHGVPFIGHGQDEVDLEVTVDRTRQLLAIEEHPSQAVPGSVLWRRLELQQDTEHLRWLHRP